MMQPIPDDPREVAEAALRYEAEGRKILTDARDKAHDPLAKATFEFLANQEIKHMADIRSFVASLAGTEAFDAGGLGPPITLRQAGEQITGLFHDFREKFEATPEEGDERLEVYQVAMDMERRGYDFYSAAAALAADGARILYDFLAAEELRHFEIIQDTYTFIKQPDAIMAIEERWMQI